MILSPTIQDSSAVILEQSRDYCIVRHRSRWESPITNARPFIKCKLTFSTHELEVLEIKDETIDWFFNTNSYFSMWVTCPTKSTTFTIPDEFHDYLYIARAYINAEQTHFGDFVLNYEWLSSRKFNLDQDPLGTRRARVNLNWGGKHVATPMIMPAFDLPKFTPETLEQKIRLLSKFA